MGFDTPGVSWYTVAQLYVAEENEREERSAIRRVEDDQPYEPSPAARFLAWIACLRSVVRIFDRPALQGSERVGLLLCCQGG